MGFMSSTITQICNRQRFAWTDKVVHASHPERLHVGQMTCMFLDRPSGLRFPRQNFMRYTGQQFFEPCRSAQQPNTHVPIELYGKTEVEFSFKPSRDGAHRIHTYHAC